MRIIKIVVIIFFLSLVFTMFYNLIFALNRIFDRKKTFDFFGNEMFIVEDDNMNPTLNKNDVVIIDNLNNGKLKLGDMIVIYKNKKAMVRRISYVSKNNIRPEYIVKSDKFYFNDNEKIQLEEIEGRVEKQIEGIGFLFKIIQSRVLTVIILLMFLCIHLYIKNIKRKNKEKRKRMNIKQ